jgi:hypothetical protein
MKAKLLCVAVLVGGCGDVDNPQPRLQTYGVIIPTCILFCVGTVTSADLEDSAAQTTTNQSSAVGAP